MVRSESAPLVSVVIPMFNEVEVLPLFVERLRPVLDGLGEPYEVVAVDDGSTQPRKMAAPTASAPTPEPTSTVDQR